MSPQFVEAFYRFCTLGNLDCLKALIQSYKPTKAVNQFTLTSPNFTTHPMIMAVGGNNIDVVKYVWEDLGHGVDSNGISNGRISSQDHTLSLTFTREIKKSCLVITLIKKNLTVCRYLYSIGPDLLPADFIDDDYDAYTDFIREWEQSTYVDMLISRNRFTLNRSPELFPKLIATNLLTIFIATHNNTIEQHSLSYPRLQKLDQAQPDEVFDWLLGIVPSQIDIPEFVRSPFGDAMLRKFLFTHRYPLVVKAIQLGASLERALALFPNRQEAIHCAVSSALSGGSVEQLKQILQLLGLDTSLKIVQQLGSSPLSVLLKYQRLDFFEYYKSIGARFEYDANLYLGYRHLLPDHAEFDQFYNNNFLQIDADSSYINHDNKVDFFIFGAKKDSNCDLLRWLIETYPKYLPIIAHIEPGRLSGLLRDSDSVLRQSVIWGRFDIVQLLSSHGLRLSPEHLSDIHFRLKWPIWDTSSGFLNPLPPPSDKEWLLGIDWLISEHPAIVEPGVAQRNGAFVPILSRALHASSIAGTYIVLRHTDRVGEPVLHYLGRRQPYGDTPIMRATIGHWDNKPENDGIGAQCLLLLLDRAIDVMIRCGNDFDKFDQLVGTPIATKKKRGGGNKAKKEVVQQAPDGGDAGDGGDDDSQQHDNDNSRKVETVGKTKGTRKKKIDVVLEEKETDEDVDDEILNSSKIKKNSKTDSKTPKPRQTRGKKVTIEEADDSSDQEPEPIVVPVAGKRGKTAPIETSDDKNLEILPTPRTTRQTAASKVSASKGVTNDGDDPVANTGRQRSRRYKD
jgi:hypothetical protein